MRITFALPGYQWKPTGGARVVYEYANGLADRGHEVTVVHPRRLGKRLEPASLQQRLRSAVARLGKVFIKPSLSWQSLRSSVTIAYLPDLSAQHFPDGDAVFATYWQTAEHVLRLPPSRGRGFYLVMDFDPWLGPKRALEETWRWPLKKVTISNWLYQKVVSAGPPQDDTVNIAIGVDHGRFRITQDVAARRRRVAMHYGLASYKAPEDGLRALEIAKTRHPDLEAIMFGPVARRPRGLAPWVNYRGYCSDEQIIEIYNSSQIYVCCSLAEGFALPPAEAMACGCAVASTDCGGIREYAENGVNALLSLPRDPEGLAANIIRLVEDGSLRHRLAFAGHRRIQDFTWDRSTDLLEDFIKRHLTAN